MFDNSDDYNTRCSVARYHSWRNSEERIINNNNNNHNDTYDKNNCE